MSVQTVLGPIPANELGHTQPHEHVLIDIRTPQPDGAEVATGPETIELTNYYQTRREHTPYSRQLLSESDAIEELALYGQSGGKTVVDATSGGLARDPEGLVRVSRATGVNIVMGCGYYVEPYHPPGLAARPAESLAEEFATELTDGVGPTRIKPGIIGEIGMSWPVHPVEATVLAAAAQAQAQTGVALMIHPGRDSAAPFDHLRQVERAGGDPNRTIMSHVDRTLFVVNDMIALAATGVYVEFDLFGQESSYYPMSDIDMPNDAQRVNYIRALVEAGYGEKILIAQDICHKTNLRKYGGEGYSHLIEHVLPLMRRKGMSDGEIKMITHDNPARILSV